MASGKKKPGIYKIFNITNNKFYIGSSKDVISRKASHWYLLRKGKHLNPHLQNAWNKYGEKSFSFEIIEKCDATLITIREQYYLDTLLPEYNIRKIAENNTGFSHSIESKEKIGIGTIKNWKNEEYRKKTIESRYKQILAYNSNGEFYKEYNSIKEAGKDLNLFATAISCILNNRCISRGGWMFTYKTGEDFPKNIKPIKNFYKKRDITKVQQMNSQKVELIVDSISEGIFNSVKLAYTYFINKYNLNIAYLSFFNFRKTGGNQRFMKKYNINIKLIYN